MSRKPSGSRFAAGVITLVIFLGTLVLLRARMNYQPYADAWRNLRERYGDLAASFDSTLLLIIASVLGVMFVARCRRPRRVCNELGLTRPVLPALCFAFVAALPMLIGYSIAGSVSWDWSTLLRGTVIAAFLEELYFRGFAYRMLHQRANWGFPLAAGFTGLIFGLTHVPTTSLLSLELNTSQLFTILITGIGGVFYAWLFMRWQFNLWVPIFLHLFMNLWWMLFAAGDNAVGGWTANLCRGLTIAVAVVLTLKARRVVGLRRGMNFEYGGGKSIG